MLYLRRSQDLPISTIAARLLPFGNRSYSKDYDSSSDDEKKHITPENEKTATVSPGKENEESASAKLNRLLASMDTSNGQINFVKQTDIIPKPGEVFKKLRLQRKGEVESKDIFAAAKKVASLLGEEKKQQTESELLTRLLGGNATADTTSSKEGKLSSNEAEMSLSELIVGMKINRRPNQSAYTRSEYVRRSLSDKENRKQPKWQQQAYRERQPTERRREAEVYTGSANLKEANPLGIFREPSTLKSVDLLPTWSYLYEQALKVQVSQPPSNYFDKLARWTEQGKVWRFPIDNEQDWLEEKDVHFSEHIFLDQFLEEWCPNRGPVRHFMELVCVGLSKNPYISAKEKKDHIMWYKNYFESKKDILGELMAKNPKIEKYNSEQQQKQVET